MRKMRWLFKIAVWIPFFYQGYLLFSDQIGAQPAEELNKTFGTITVRLFILNLYFGVFVSLFRPLPQAFRWIPLERRFLGISTFLYAVVHIVFFVIKEGSVSHAVSETIQRLYLNLGAGALVILVFLFLTSNNLSVRLLTYRTWKRLHRLIYLAAFLILGHLVLIEKADVTEAILYFLPLLGFQIYRLTKQFTRPSLF